MVRGWSLQHEQLLECETRCRRARGTCRARQVLRRCDIDVPGRASKVANRTRRCKSALSRASVAGNQSPRRGCESSDRLLAGVRQCVQTPFRGRSRPGSQRPTRA
eukprot:2521713-Alexandrium_andersonii.AAC.1